MVIRTAVGGGEDKPSDPFSYRSDDYPEIPNRYSERRERGEHGGGVSSPNRWRAAASLETKAATATSEPWIRACVTK
ncbi:hypothetical protein V6N13_111638 [Hibiscus sabdariffa]|uniref:Uncharacterized protein n=1 Tax=Hibiscus sabdariffa TaxID=183260 RepID=A0ABR2TKU6_9ROSI